MIFGMADRPVVVARSAATEIASARHSSQCQGSNHG
jgi:hypothetical protein